MNNNQLYHRQCFRHHERASIVAADNIAPQSSDSVADFVSNHERSYETASVTVSAVSGAVEVSDAPALPSATKVACTSPQTRSPMSASASVSTCESAISCDKLSLKPLADGQQGEANNTTTEGSSGQVRSTDVDMSVQEISVPDSHGLTNTSFAVATSIESHDRVPAEVNISAEELVLNSFSLSSGARSPRQTESTVDSASEASEQQQNEVYKRTKKPLLPEKPATTLSLVPVTAGESLSSSAEHVTSCVTKDTVTLRPAPMSRSSPSDTTSSAGEGLLSSAGQVLSCFTNDTVILRRSPPMSRSRPRRLIAPVARARQSSCLSSVSVSQAETPSSVTAQPTASVSQSAEDVANAATTAASDVETCSSSVAVDCKVFRPRRPAPLPPPVSQHETSVISMTPSDSLTITVSMSSTESLQETTAADDQVPGEHSLLSDTERQSSKDEIIKHDDELPASEASQDQPVPTPRRRHLPKLNMPSTGVEASSASSEDDPAVISSNAIDAARPSLVPKPRKQMPSDVEPAEMTDRPKPDEVAKQDVIELTPSPKSNVDDAVVRDSCTIVATCEERGIEIPATDLRSSQIGTVSSSQWPCTENKSPSLSPSHPARYPRSKKRYAAPPPPVPLSPASLKPEPNDAPESEPQMLGSQQCSPVVSTPSPVANKPSDKSMIVNSGETVTPDSKPTRKKISPRVKFTFEKDVFRPTNATTNMSSSELLKPSRPAPPRPTSAAAVIKRKVWQCMFVCLSFGLFGDTLCVTLVCSKTKLLIVFQNNSI